MKSREEALQSIEGKAFDFCIIGGGATGAGCALDSRLRGLKTVLIDAGDFAGATSSKSTKVTSVEGRSQGSDLIEAFESAITLAESFEQHLGGMKMSRVVTVSGGPSGLRQTISVGTHQLFSDEPKGAGGGDQGPDPYELLLAALGSCTNMTLRIYADRKRWPLQEVRVVLRHSKSYANDCADCEQPTSMLDRIERQITLIGELTEEQRQRLLEIADLCPVHRTLTSKIEIRTGLAEPT